MTTTVLYANLKQISDVELQNQLNKLPDFMLKDISRFKQSETRALKIIARLMLLRCLEDTDQGQLINKWEVTNYHKPQIPYWFPFNISHSSELSVFAYGDETVGVDIEKIDVIKYDLIEYFHPLERQYIYNSINKEDAFFEIWVKKEAFLKALGVGLSFNEGLDSFNCVNNMLYYRGNNWFFFELKIDAGYKCFLCCQKIEEVKVEGFDFITRSARFI